MAVKKGTLSIDSENIFPIIKKWVYSDHDIFVRELISNGCDAVTKLKKLDMMGEYELPEDYKAKIEVIVNPEEKTMKFIDNGLGMTAEEVEEYITQIAFSGATQFLEKYKDKTTEDDMIGHFGLGFYSAFMVADEVHIDTLSYKEGSTPVHWTCDGGTEYEMADGNKTEPGTEITLFLNEESLEFANEYRMREVIEKYCSFMPVNIYLSKANAEQEYETIDEADLREDDVVVEHIHEDAKTEEKENDKGEKEVVEVSPAKDKVKINKRPVSLSDTQPLWMKHPNECTLYDHTTNSSSVATDEFCCGMNNDICAVLNGTDQVWGAEGIIDDQRQAVLVRDGCNGIDIGDIAVGVAQSFQIDGLGVGLDGILHLSQIVCIDKGSGDTELGQGVLQQVVAAAVDGLLCHDVVTGLCQCLNGVGDGSSAGSGSQSSHAAFQSSNALLEHILGGVGQTAVDVAGVCQTEAVRSVLAVAEHIGSGLVNGHCAGIGRGIGLLLANVKLQGLKFIFRHCYLPILIY